MLTVDSKPVAREFRFDVSRPGSRSRGRRGDRESRDARILAATARHWIRVSWQPAPFAATDWTRARRGGTLARLSRREPRMRTIVVLNQDQMGHGDRELGRKILATFLRKAIALEGLDAIVLYNSGVKLLVKDSPVLAELALLAERGIDLVPCGTCVQHFGIELAAGKTSDMDTILRELSAAEKVITL
jgi:hypothetical protein